MLSIWDVCGVGLVHHKMVELFLKNLLFTFVQYLCQNFNFLLQKVDTGDALDASRPTRFYPMHIFAIVPNAKTRNGIDVKLLIRAEKSAAKLSVTELIALTIALCSVTLDLVQHALPKRKGNAPVASHRN